MPVKSGGGGGSKGPSRPPSRPSGGGMKQPSRPPSRPSTPSRPAGPPKAPSRPAGPPKSPPKPPSRPAGPPKSPPGGGFKQPPKPPSDAGLKRPPVPQQQKVVPGRPVPQSGIPVASRFVGRTPVVRTGGVVLGGAALGTIAAGAFGPETVQQVEALQDRYSRLLDDLMLPDVHNTLNEMESAIAVLPAEVAALRTRRYVFRSFLENKIEVLSQQWAETRSRVMGEIDRRSYDLDQDAQQAEYALSEAVAGNRTAVMRAEMAVNNLERKVAAVKEALTAMFGTLRDNIAQTRGEVVRISWAMAQMDESKLEFLAGEDLIGACRAQFLQRENEGPTGVLFLTDERLLFEQKEEVATKVLFITTSKESVQRPIFRVPVGLVEDLQSTDKSGFMQAKQELLSMRFGDGAEINGANFRLLEGATNEEWTQLIGRVKTGEIDRERTAPKEEAVVEAVQNIPTKCPTCGATLSVEVTRGMREINCDYCGSVIRI